MQNPSFKQLIERAVKVIRTREVVENSMQFATDAQGQDVREDPAKVCHVCLAGALMVAQAELAGTTLGQAKSALLGIEVTVPSDPESARLYNVYYLDTEDGGNALDLVEKRDKEGMVAFLRSLEPVA